MAVECRSPFRTLRYCRTISAIADGPQTPAGRSVGKPFHFNSFVHLLGSGAAAGSLSGGNLQKFVVGREILQTPNVLVVSQPTWGVDAGAAATIHQALADLASEGAAILVISQDLDELLAITDRLAVINVGVLSNALVTGQTPPRSRRSNPNR